MIPEGALYHIEAAENNSSPGGLRFVVRGGVFPQRGARPGAPVQGRLISGLDGGKGGRILSDLGNLPAAGHLQRRLDRFGVVMPKAFALAAGPHAPADSFSRTGETCNPDVGLMATR